MKESGTSSKSRSRHSKPRATNKSKTHGSLRAKQSISVERKEDLTPKEKDLNISLNEWEIEQLPEDHKPLSCFADDPEQLLDQLFLSIRSSDIMQMVPKTLKISDIDEVKRICLGELRRLSKDFILCILQGGDPSKHTAELNLESPVKEKVKTTETSSEVNPSLKRKLPEDALLVESSNDSKKYAMEEQSKNIVDVDVGKSDTPTNDTFLELYPTSKEMENMAKSNKKELSPLTWNDDTDCELLELEMRARAIRSLLRSRGLHSSDEEP